MVLIITIIITIIIIINSLGSRRRSARHAGVCKWLSDVLVCFYFSFLFSPISTQHRDVPYWARGFGQGQSEALLQTSSYVIRSISEISSCFSFFSLFLSREPSFARCYTDVFPFLTNPRMLYGRFPKFRRAFLLFFSHEPSFARCYTDVFPFLTNPRMLYGRFPKFHRVFMGTKSAQVDGQFLFPFPHIGTVRVQACVSRRDSGIGSAGNANIDTVSFQNFKFVFAA